MIRVAIASFAHMHAYSYARVLKELEAEGRVVFRAVFDDNRERLSRVFSMYKPEKVYEDIHALAEDRDVDAVIVASENSRHKDHAIPLIKSGKHVLVEKPIATRYRDALEMVEEARRRGVKLQTAFVMRYHDASAEVKRLIDRGVVGEIRAITSTNHGKNPMDWFVKRELSGGGALMDHIVHVADLVRWYTGREFREVVAFVGRNLRPDIEVEDNGLVIARLDNDVPVSIDCSWSRPSTWPVWGDVYMHIVGERGSITLNAFNQNISLADQESFKWVYYGSDADRNMIESFIESIERDLEPLASGLDGLRALEVVIAAYKSWFEKRIVRISEIRE
ncbi:MAG: Gfo/Idh/MocA family oxidoreductase [Sulfolobales archaeon]